MLLGKAIDALLMATRADGLSHHTVGAYQQKLAPLPAFLRDVDVEEICTDDLRRYIAHLMDRAVLYADHPTHAPREGRLSPFTVGSHVRAMKRLFNWLEEEGALEINPARRIKTPRPKRQEPKGIEEEDMLALLATTEGGSTVDLRDRSVILFLADTGCRAGGLCGLRVQDLDLDAGLATVTEKRGKARLVPFSPPTAEALRAWLEVRPQDKGPWVFVGLGIHSKGAMSPNSVLQMLRRRAERAGVTGPVNPHAFRHAFAPDFLMTGGDLATLADLLGHESMEVTKDYYAIFTVQELQEKHRRHSPVARLFGGCANGEAEYNKGA